MEISTEVLRTVLYGHWRLAPNSNGNVNDVAVLPLVSTPQQVRLGFSSLPTYRYGVFSTCWIKAGTEMGPYIGKVVQRDEINMTSPNELMWEIFDDRGEIIYFLEADHGTYSSWLSYVNCARNDQEQNLEIYQSGREIYYRATKDIPPEHELLVWYSAAHHTYMGIPCLLPYDTSPNRNKWIAESTTISNNRTPKHHQHPGLPLTPEQLQPQPPKPQQQQEPQQSTNGSKAQGGTLATAPQTIATRLHCVLCRRGFNSRSNLRSHMRIHTLEKPFVCKFCNRSFSQSSTLRNHTRLHTGEKPYRCTVCQSSYSQLAGLRAHQRSARHRPPALDSNFNIFHKQRAITELVSGPKTLS